MPKKLRIISKTLADKIDYLMTNEPKSETDCFGEDEYYSVTEYFDDGYEMDIKLCGVQYDPDASNLPWTEAVLFKNGSEVTHSEVSEDFFGEWHLIHNDIDFIIDVVRGKNSYEHT